MYSSTRFKQQCAYHQEVELYSIWYRILCDRPKCTCTPHGLLVTVMCASAHQMVTYREYYTRFCISILCKWLSSMHLHTIWSISIPCKWPSGVHLHTRWSLTENTIPDAVSVFSVSDREVCTCTPDNLLVFSVSDHQVCICTPDGHLQRILYQILYQYSL